MKSMAVCLCLLVLASNLASRPSAAGAPAPATASRPASEELKDLAGAAKAAREKLEGVEQRLLELAQEQSLPAELRRQAILELAETRGARGIDFLIENVALRLGVSVIKGDDDALKLTPCYYVLIMIAGKGEWAVLHPVLRRLDKELPLLEVARLAHVLRDLAGLKLAKAIVQNELQASAISDTRLKNLKAMAHVLEQ